MKLESKRLTKNPSPFSMDGFFLAGGSLLSNITKKEISDYDYYPKTKEALISGIYYLLEVENCFIVGISDRAITLKSNNEKSESGERAIIQLMTYDTFETADKIFENFDFTVCMAAFDCDTKEYFFHDDFFPDVASKTLRVNVKTKYPLNSLLRTTKYREKGYYIAKTEQIKLGYAIAKKGFPNSWEEFETQIGGSYGRIISLNVGDKEYSFDNVIEFLDNMIFDFSQYEQIEDESLLKTITPQKLEILFGDDIIFYTFVGNHKLILDKNGFIIHCAYNSQEMIKTKTELFFDNLLNSYKPNISEWQHDYIMGYKFLIKNGDVYHPGNRRNIEFVYRLNEEKEEPKYPHLFVYYEKPKVPSITYMNNKEYKTAIVEAKIKIEDIVNLTETKEAFTTKKLTLIKEINHDK